MKKGCPVAVNSTLQKDGRWRINKINLEHSHEIDLNARPFLRRRQRYIPPQLWDPLVSNDRLGIEDEEEREEEEEEEEGAVSVALEQPLDSSGDEVVAAFNLDFKCHCILIKKLKLKSHFS